MTEHVDTIIAGAGVIGLAIARRLAQAGREVIVLEAEDAIGTGISARNSEVIHAGIYYPEGSLKAALCKPGRDALYEFAESHGVTYKRLGKLIVATADNELDALSDLKQKAEASGVDDLEWLDGAEAAKMEPALRCAGALLSPSTGIIDSHAYMLALQGDMEKAGGAVALSSPLVGGAITKDGITINVGGAEPMALGCREFINAAALGAQDVARSLDGYAQDSVPALYYAKGNYFTLSGKSPFTRMIYPVPAPAGLGIHSSTDLGGQTKFGPDVEWVEKPNYVVDPARADKFYTAIRRYWPDLPDGALQPGYVGVRPKLVPKGVTRGDWVIHGPETHKLPGVVSLYGIESPGLTSSLAIADYVAGLLGVEG